MSESQRNEARDPATDPARLTELASSADEYVRRGVARNASTPAEVLTQLADDSESWVRKDVAGNPSTPVDLITRMAGDPDSRWGVAQNPAAPMDLILLLADDPDDSVRAGVAENPSTPAEVLTRLADDSEADVRRGVALNASAPVELITVLEDDSELPVRAGVAWNSSAPAEVLGRLADDPAVWVRSGVGQNPSAPVEVLGRLAGDPEESVRESVADNPMRPVEVLEPTEAADTLLTEAEDPATDPARLAELATSAEEHVRRRALLNPACPNEALEASGLVFLFTIQQASWQGETRTWHLEQHGFARDLIAAERLPMDATDELEVHELLFRALGDWDDFGGGGYEETTDLLTWAGTGAPDWWSDWSVINWSELSYSNPFIEDALNRRHDALFCNAMGEPGDGDDENVEGMAFSVAFSGRESSQQTWVQIWADVDSAVGDSPEELQGVADRWLAPGNGDERPELIVRFIEGALARNPASPPDVVQQMAAADDAELRWLVTRNPGASDEVKAMAALSLSVDERFEQDVPEGDLRISHMQLFSLGVRARIWPVDECPFVDELPYDSRTDAFHDDISSAAWELFDGTGPGGVVYEFEGQIVDPDYDE